MTIIPAIDIINGKCVRLTKGDYAQQKIYNDSPVDVARQFADAGFTRLHVVDLDGARAGKIINMAVLENIAAATHMVIDFGGGVKHINDVEAVLNAGAAMVTIGSLAVKHPEILEAWIMEFGARHFFIGADVLEGNVKISGWQQDGGIGIFDFIENLIRVGATNIFCTDIAKDGMMQGPAVELYTNMLERYPQINLTASGGVSHIDDVKQLKEIGCSGAIIGKAIYENLITLEQLIILNS
jgi:phosphoribosylformimino-5-aminoimidazole carboxamide ribotide isomerase